MKKGDEVEGEGRDLEDLEMGDIKNEDGSVNEEEESLLVGVQENYTNSKEGVEYLGSTQLPNIIITPSRRQKPCTLATPDPDIQLAEPTRTSSSVSLATGGGALSLCGPNPAKISLFCVVILSIWMSWVFIIHLNKEMSDMAVQLEESNKNIKVRDESELAFRVSTEEKLRKLEIQLDRFLKRKRGGKKVGRPEEVSPSIADSSTLSPISDDDDVGACTSSGPCVFPFTYDGVEHTSCRRTWADIRAWCPTKPSNTSQFVPGADNWDYCTPC